MGALKSSAVSPLPSHSSANLAQGLRSYGLNPNEWLIDWTQSEVRAKSIDGQLAIIKNILIRSREDGAVTFAGEILNFRRGDAGHVDWLSVEACDWRQ